MKTLFILPIFISACSSTSITSVEAPNDDGGLDSSTGGNASSIQTTGGNTSNSTGGGFSTSTGNNTSTGGQKTSTGGTSTSTGGTSGVCIPTGNPCETKDYQIENSTGGLMNTNICNSSTVNDSCGNPVLCNNCDNLPEGITAPLPTMVANDTNRNPGCTWVVQGAKIIAVYYSGPNSKNICVCGYSSLAKAQEKTGIQNHYDENENGGAAILAISCIYNHP